ncbi:histidine kinase [Streptomyces sp. LP05-1]|uniref:histidine kinase n=1 Tax=Streptomyces pyxinae TaxID=2970734 RepID=A0ABT2CMD0_9ACTN|nr:histidine kinase [Streptomyces sp. LP05-1]MCS0638490.1 histidine kinase [Streptomyces sp. LP05-1]
MIRTDGRLPPALVLLAQAAVWPGPALACGGAGVAAGELLAAVVLGAVMTTALLVRSSHPVPVLALTGLACAVGAGALPAGAVALWGTAGVALALGAVAVERDTTTAVLSAGTLAAWQALHGVTLHGIGGPHGLDLALTALLYAAACGAGIRLRRSRAAGAAAAWRLNRVLAGRRRLPEAERGRMERELHDVAAHHLTAVVVTVGAALGLRERRPELAAEALEFAIRTGREAGQALSAVHAPRPAPETGADQAERLRALAAGIGGLGQPVTCDLEAVPDGAAGEAAYGIVREALTNAVRHAPGAPTSVRCRADGARVEITVDNGPAPGDRTGSARPAAGLGGGRGHRLLRERAREAGGTLTSGPTGDGGWRVHALLPGGGATAPPPPVPRARRAAQFTVAAGLCVQPFVPVFLPHAHPRTPGATVSAGALQSLLVVAQAVALLWLRRAPLAAPGVLCALAALWPVATAMGGTAAGPVVVPAVLSALGTGTALALLTVRAAAGEPRTGRALPGRRAGAAGAAAHAVSLAGGVLVTGGTPARAGAAAGTALLTIALLRGAGGWYARRTRHRRAAYDDRLARSVEDGVREAWAERRRITTGLETTVLDRTAAMVRTAEAGELAGTADRAREALAAMRSLLDTVHDDRAGGRKPVTDRELVPQPTLGALDLLVGQYRASGRRIEVRYTGRAAGPLSPLIDLTAYRAAEILLAAGGEEPVTLVFDQIGGGLALTATGVPAAVRPAVRARLTARTDPLGGTLTLSRTGPVRLLLPATPATPAGPSAPDTVAATGPSAPGTDTAAPPRGDQEDPTCPSP